MNQRATIKDLIKEMQKYWFWNVKNWYYKVDDLFK